METLLKPFLNLARSYFRSRLARILINLIATGITILIMNRFLDEDIQAIADVAILAFGVFATLQTEAMSEDLRTYVTKELIKAGEIIGVQVLDHVILGNPSHASLRELGLL